MGGYCFHISAKLQNLGFIRAGGRHYFLHNKIAFGNGAGFIHYNGVYVFKCFHYGAALKQNAVARPRADAGEKCQRHAEHQCAGAAYYKKGQRRVNPVLPVAGNIARHKRRKRCHNNHKGSIYPCKAGNKAVNLRFGSRCVFHAVQNTRNHGFRKHFFHAYFQHAVGINAAAGNFVAVVLAYRHRLACYRRSINKAVAFYYHAVQRYAVTGAHQQNIAYMGVRRRNYAHFFAYKQVNGFRAHINRVHNLPAAFFHRTVFKIFAHTVKEHYADGFFISGNYKRAQRCNGH